MHGCRFNEIKSAYFFSCFNGPEDLELFVKAINFMDLLLSTRRGHLWWGVVIFSASMHVLMYTIHLCQYKSKVSKRKSCFRGLFGGYHPDYYKSPRPLCAAFVREHYLIMDKHTEISVCIPCVMVLLLHSASWAQISTATCHTDGRTLPNVLSPLLRGR